MNEQERNQWKRQRALNDFDAIAEGYNWNMNEVWEEWRRSCSFPVKPRPLMVPIAEYPPSKATATQFCIIDKELERDLMRIWVCPELLYDTEGNLIGMETLERPSGPGEEIEYWDYETRLWKTVPLDQVKDLTDSWLPEVKKEPVHWDCVIVLSLAVGCAAMLLIIGLFAFVTQTFQYIRSVC